MKKIAIIFLISLALALPRTAKAQDAEEIGMWTGAVFASLLYTPLKGTFCLLMALGGGLSYAGTIPMENTEVSEDILKWGYYGDWMIRPEHLVLDSYPKFVGFDEEIHFID